MMIYFFSHLHCEIGNFVGIICWLGFYVQWPIKTNVDEVSSNAFDIKGYMKTPSSLESTPNNKEFKLHIEVYRHDHRIHLFQAF